MTKKSVLEWASFLLMGSLGLFLLWDYPNIDLWYPIFNPHWEPLIFIFALFCFQLRSFQKQGISKKKQSIFFLFLILFSGAFLTLRDRNQALYSLDKLSEKSVNANFGDPLLNLFDLAEEWSNQSQFWMKYQEQEGWISWLEKNYFKEKLTGFEVVDFRDTVVNTIQVNLEEGYKTQIFHVVIPKNDSVGLWMLIERKSTPALLFEEAQQSGIVLPSGASLGIYVDGMLQQVQGEALFSPFLKESVSELKRQGGYLNRTAKNGNRQTLATLPFDFQLVLWSKIIWFSLLTLLALGWVNFSAFQRRWKTEKRFTIQWVVLGMVLLSASIFSIYSIRISKEQYHEEILRSKLNEIEKFSAQLREILSNTNPNDPTTQTRLNRLSRIWEVDFRLSEEGGNAIFQTFYFDQPLQFLNSVGRHEKWYELRKQKIRSIQYQIHLPKKNINFEWFLFNEENSQSMENSGKMAHFMAGILLLLIVFSWLVGNWLIRPFVDLKEQLITSGKDHLTWQEDDEIGKLVQAYNEVLNKVKIQALELAEQEKEKAWKNMARQVAHEIRNPLTPMKLQLQLLERMPEGEKKQLQLSKTLAILFEQMNSLERISSEFSSFANFPDPQFQTNNLVVIVQNAIDLYSSQAKISFQHPEVLMISIDAEMIMRAVGNLIKNAIQAYGEQEKFGEIGISLSENENDIVLAIEDWAGGIPEEIQSKIFQPNFTTKSSGMGLGLSLIQRTIESHQGNIQLEVKPHVGCIFVIRFPKDHGQ